MKFNKREYHVLQIWHRVFTIITGYPVVFIPFIIMAVFDVSLLLAVTFIPRGAISLMSNPFINIIFKNEILSPPFNMIVLPKFYAGIRDCAGFAAGIFFTGMTISLIRQAAHDIEPKLRYGVTKTFRKYLNLIIIWFINMGICSFLIRIIGVIGQYFENNLLIYAVKMILLIGLQVIIAFAISATIVENKKISSAFMRSFKLLKNYPLNAFFFVAVPGIIIIAIRSMAFNIPWISSYIDPKVTLYILASNIIMITTIDFFITSSATVLLLTDRKDERRNF